MTYLRRSFLQIALALLALGLLATAAAQVELRMTWYDDGNEGAVMRDLLDRFEAENPDIKITIDTVPYAAGIQQSLPLQLASGDGPDLDQHHPRPHDGGPLVIPALGLLLGIALGVFLDPAVPPWLQPYLPIAVVAALDAVFGGLRAVLDGIFNDKVFVVSFLANVVVAAFIVFLGDQLGVGSQMSTGVVVVLGVRIFSNVASIRRHLFNA